MKVLWICNIMPPMVAQALGLEYSVKEGWITGILEEMVRREEVLELAIAYPVLTQEKKEGIPVSLQVSGIPQEKRITCYEFVENINQPEIYGGKQLEQRMKEIIEDFRPGLLHIYGTEYGHALAAVRSFPEKSKILVGLQGIVTECAAHYMAELPEKVQRKKSFRDILKQDGMKQQQEKFFLRGELENQLFAEPVCVTGRTEFDKSSVHKVNSKLTYFSMNETMRKEFYSGRWNLESCVPHRIFFSQADYPLKGFHHLLEAAGLLVKKYPDITIHVAGNNITAYGTLKEKIKISAYGKYLRSLIRRGNLQEKVFFLGKLSAGQIKEEYLKSHCYVCASSIENSPNSMAEAMLLGTPVVASRTGGIPSMLEEEKEGLLFESGNASALAECIDRIWQDNRLAVNLSKEARKRAYMTHDPETNYHRLLEIYTRMNGKEV